INQKYFVTRLYFNPRTHEECDKGTSLSVKVEMYFNPRTHEECDISAVKINPAPKEFQSTHSRGVRRPYLLTVSIPFGFQSTHSRGVRLSMEITKTTHL